MKHNDALIAMAYREGQELMQRASKPLGTMHVGWTEDRRFRSSFGTGVDTVLDAWTMMERGGSVPNEGRFEHMLWALIFLSAYPKNETKACTLMGGIDPKTMRKWVWPFIEGIAGLHDSVISFENRKKEDSGNDCLLSVDGTDVRIALHTCKKFYSHKTKKSALRYEVGLCIKTGDICWINGGYPPGVWNDDMVFKDALVHELEKGERVEADGGYRGSAPTYAKCPGTVWTEAEKKEMQQRARSRQETVNLRLKNWKILAVPYRHDVYQHQNVFFAVAVLTQLAIENGEQLFEVDYND